MKDLYRGMFIALGVGFITAILSTACITKDTALGAVDSEPTPALIALQNQRYTVAKGVLCNRRTTQPLLPHVSILIANDWLTIALHYGNIQESSPKKVEVRSWKIPNVDGYDWPAARKALLEIHELLTKKETKEQTQVSLLDGTTTPQLKRSTDKFHQSESAMKAGILSIVTTSALHEIEIAAEDEVRYGDILSVIDLAVETDFENFTLVAPSNLPFVQE